MDPASSAAAVLLMFGMLGPAPATAAPDAVTGATQAPAVGTSARSAYMRLSPSSQKIALALYNAQTKGAAATPLTLEQIAAMKHRGRSWSQVFKGMKAQGLVHDESLARLVSNANRSAYQTSANNAVSSSNKAHPKSRPEHALSADDGASASLGSTDPVGSH